MAAVSAEWVPSLEKRTRLARLSVSTPEDVYAELRRYAVEEMSSVVPIGDEELEKALLERGSPLIDIALASFGVHWEIVAELYSRSLKPEYADETFRKGLRVACLANRVVLRRSFIWKQMGKAIEHDLTRLLAEGDDAEVAALLSNEEIDDRFLQSLYERSGAFSSLPDERWLHLIDMSADNARLVDRRDTEDGPDMGHYGLQKAVFSSLELVPVSARALRSLYRLLDRMNPAYIVKPEAGRVAAVLKKWSSLEIKDHKGRPDEGYYTSLPIVDEFRCMVASLYGAKEAGTNNHFVGKEKAQDVAERCAFYANGQLTAKDIQRLLARGPEAEIFSFAIIYNSSVFHDRKLRALIEEHCSGAEFARRYRRRCEEIRRDWPNFDPRPTAEWLQPEENENEHGEASLALLAIQKKLGVVTEQIGELRKGVLVGFLIVGAVVLFKAAF